MQGVPWGLFMATQELAGVKGGLEELEKVMEAADRKTAKDEAEAEAKVEREGSTAMSLLAEGGGLNIIREGVHIPSNVTAPMCKLPEN